MKRPMAWLRSFGLGLARAAAGLRDAIDLRTVQFYGGAALIGYAFGWGWTGAVLVTHAVVLPLLVRRGGAA